MNNTNEIIVSLKYSIIKKKEGFLLRGPLSDEIKILLEKEFENENVAKIESIDCHFSIGTKIFYSKHRSSTGLKKHSENYILNNLPSKIKHIIEDKECYTTISKNLEIDRKRNKGRYELYEVNYHKDKKIVYRYVIGFTHKRIKIISIHRNK